MFLIEIPGPFPSHSPFSSHDGMRKRMVGMERESDAGFILFSLCFISI